MTNTDPFRWKDRGLGVAVSAYAPEVVAHEVMYEDDITTLEDARVFLGPAIPVRRLQVAAGVACAIVAVLLGRAFWMQLVNGAAFQVQAERNRLRHEVVLSRRGVIRDRHGAVLAENEPSFDVTAVESLLPPEPEGRAEILGSLARTLGITVSDIEQRFASSTDIDEAIVIMRDVPYDRAVSVKILAAETPSVEVRIGSKRHYPLASSIQSLAHILGYVGAITKEELEPRRDDGYRQTDLIGKTGVEAAYEGEVRGVPGERVYEVDARHRVTAIVDEREPQDGSDVYLTLDLELQREAERALKAGMERAKVTRGVALAMDPRDGSILAAVSLPAYDNNIFSGTVSSTQYRQLLENPDHPLLPRAWAGTYPSGSTAKPVIAAAALAEGVVTPQTTVVSVGGIRVGPWFFPDWQAGGHGVTNVRRAIAWSVNTFFYIVGGGHDRFVGLGVDRLTAWMRKFGFGSPTGLDLPGEAAGFVPSREWKQEVKGEGWFIGDTYNLSIGQGDLLVTPLHIAAATAAIANGGYPVRPHFGLAHSSAEGLVNFDLTGRGERIAEPSVINVVREGMRDGVVYGSGRGISSLPIPAAGKTGTAQWRSDRANHAWFTAFAPFENPEIVVTVLLEEGVEGSSTAVPVAREILQAWIAQRGI